MSDSHTVVLQAVVNGLVCQFDGERWISLDDRLANTLNTALKLCPNSSLDILTLAERCLQMADFSGRYTITIVNHDDWAGQSPDDAG